MPGHAQWALVGVLLISLGPGCAPHRAGAHHDLVVSIAADPDLLLPPFVATTQGAEVSDLIFERLAEPDTALNTVGDRGYTPRLADRWTWSADSLSIAFHIDPHARWQDGRPVTAADVRYSFSVYLAGAAASIATAQLAGIDSVSVRDSSTAVVWFCRRSPEQFYTATYEVRILPAHLLAGIPLEQLRTSAFARAPVGSGPYRFVRWVAGSHIELAANAAYRGGPPAFARVLFTVTADPSVALTRLLTHEVDVVDRLDQTDIARVAADPSVRLIRWPSEENCFLLFNLRDPAALDHPSPTLGDWRVRRAIELAVDRRALVESVFGPTARVAQGPLPAVLLDSLFLPDTAPDIAAARRLLDAAGWTLDRRTRRRSRAGRPLRVALLVPSSSRERVAAAVLLQAQLRRVGVDVRVDETEMNTSVQRLADGQFDATLLDLNWEPSRASARQVWSSVSVAPHGANFGRYVDHTFDALLDSAVAAASPDTARALYRRAWATLVRDVPAVWLYDVVNVGAVRRPIQPVGLRADGWWSEIARWQAR